MKKVCSFFILLLCFLMVGCEDSLKIRGASISEITAVGSSNAGVSVSYAQDSRLKNLGVDIQLRFSESGEIIFWEENQEKLTFIIEKADVWYSLTNLIAIAKDKEGQENYVLHSEEVGHNYLFSSSKDNSVAIRVVAGEIVENSTKTGYILTETSSISDIFNLKIKGSDK